MIRPRGGSSYWDAIQINTPNGYLLRDRSGKILQTYGVHDLRSIQLESPEKAKTIFHKQRLTSTKDRERWYHGSWVNSWYDENGFAYRVYDTTNRTGLLDTLGNLVLPIEFASIEFLDDTYMVSKNGCFGLYSSDFKEILPVQHKYLKWVKQDVYLSCDQQCIFIDSQGNWLDKQLYDKVYFPRRSEAFMTYGQNGKHGLIDTDLNHVTDPIYNWVEALESNGYYATDSTNKMAIINEEGKQITPFKFQQNLPQYRKDGFYLVKVKIENPKEKGYRYPYLYGLVDTTGKGICDFKYESIDEFVNGRAKVRYNGYFGLIDTNGTELTEFKYTDLYATGNGLYKVRYGSSYGVIDGQGKEILPLSYMQIDCISEKMAIVRCSNRKIGFLSLDGKKDIPCIYDNAWCFKNGFARITYEGKSGCINNEGVEITGFRYDHVYEFRDKIALVKKDDKYGAISMKGQEVVPVNYTSFKYLENGAIEFRLKGQVLVYPK